MKKIIPTIRLLLCSLVFVLGSICTVSAYTTIDGQTNDMNQYSLPKGNINCAPMPSTSLKLGVRDNEKSGDVTSLQKMLIEKGYMKDQATGFFGNITVTAVKEFQKKKGIPSSGVAGQTTIAKIRGEVCPPVKQDVQGGGDGTEINPLNTNTPPEKSAPVCNSEQFLKDGKCQSFTYTCPNSKVLNVVYPKGDACGSDTSSGRLSSGVCSYPAPPAGCSYGEGPNFNSQTNCGLVLSCSSQNEDIIKTKGTPQSKKMHCPLIKMAMCLNGGSTTMDPVTCQITYCDGTKSLLKKDRETKTGSISSGIHVPEYLFYYCNGVVSHEPCQDVLYPSPVYMKASSCPMMMTGVRCNDGLIPGRDPHTCEIIPCNTSLTTVTSRTQDGKGAALLEAKRLDELAKKSYITDPQRVLLMNQKNEVLMNAGVSQ